MLTFVLFALGLALLVKGADLLVDGASSVAKKLHISTIVIGLTIVAFGTSMPEMVVNIFASLEGNTDIAIGNILGSNIANTLLILGISAMIYPLKSKKDTVWKEIPLSLLAAVVLWVMANDVFIDHALVSEVSRIDGIVLLTFFILFLFYTFNIAKQDTKENDERIKSFGFLVSFSYIVSGLLALVVGGKWIVDGAIKIAEILEVSESLIGLTIVAIGTSLPELATSAVAAFKKQSDIAIGNVVGSNIFNIFWILGISSTIHPLAFNTNSSMDILVTVFASLILFSVMFIGKKHTIERWQGALMLFLFLIYTCFLIAYR